MSRYDNYSRERSSHHGDRSSDYTYSAGNYPTSYEESRQIANVENPAYEAAPPLKQLTYEPETPFYPPPPPSNLEVPDSRSRPRSLPPPDEYRQSSRGRRRGRGYYRDSDSEDSKHGRARSPVEKARNFVDKNFTDSTVGLSIGALGAIVGGLAVREAVDATSKHNSHHHEDPALKRNQLIGTVVGAAVGALGANAVEKRLEVHREKERIKQDKWERKFRPGSDVVEKRELIARPRSSSGNAYGWKRDWDPWDDRDRHRPRSRGVGREVDPDARSWKNVEDWLNDDRNDNKSRSNEYRSTEGGYRY